MAERNIYLKIEPIENYSAVAPMDKVAPPIVYRRDCLYGTGHANGVIPEAEVLARSLTALVYREYHDPDFLFPVVDKLVDADINEPIWSRRVPGAVIYAQPGDLLKITVFNADSAAHSLHVHGLEYGIDSDGSWPFGTQSSDARRSDEICPGTSWTYTFRVTEESIGAWPFHDHSVHPTHAIDRGLVGGIIVLPRGRPRPPVIELPDHIRELLESLRERRRKRPFPFPPGPLGPHGPHQPPHRPLDPDNLMPGAVHPRLDPAERVRPGHDVARPIQPMHGGEGQRPPDEFELHLPQIQGLLDEFVLNRLVRQPRKPPAEPPTLHVPLFFHVLKDEHAVPSFDSGDIEELTGIYELTFNDAGDFDYFCRYHPFMVGTVQVVAGGPATATVHIVDAPAMGFSPQTVSVGVGGAVRWENLSQQHHTVTSRQGAAMATHCFNGRGFVGNSPTIIARSGQHIRWYVFNLDIGETWHNFHPHSMRWRFAGETIDVRSIGPAESFVVETVAPPVLLLTEDMERIQEEQHRPDDAKRYDLVGDFLFHCHVHHHMMNGMVGLVRSHQSVWLTDKMVAELEATQGLPLDQGTNACPPVTIDRCAGAGRWETVAGGPEVTLMHSMLVPTTQKILFWGYTRMDQTRLWDYSTPAGAYSAPTNQPADLLAGPDPVGESDLWSAEHEYLDTATGAILAHGGFSPNKAFVFDANGLSWSRVDDTAEDRFYATTLSLDDGRIITLFGSFSKSFEIYQHGAGWSPPIAVPAGFNIYQYYPWTYLLPDGRLFIAGHQNPARRFDPTAPVDDPAETFPTLHGADRSSGGENGTSVLLPLRPPDYRPRVIIAGGNNPAPLSSVEIIDLAALAPVWQALPDMNHARGNLTAVLLPTGEVFVAGGLIGGGDGGPAEILDAESAAPAWRVGPTMTYERAYHSSFLLLADGSVLGGGDPAREPDGSPTPHERFFPAYFDMPRPEITNAPGQVAYGQPFTIDTPHGNDIVEVIVMRPGAVTHGFNMTQRAVECVITGSAAGSVDVEAPPDARIAPPGWYLLFVLSGLRVPSVGQWIRVVP